jgi:hypothetical protein
MGDKAVEGGPIPDGAETIIDLYGHSEPPYDFEEDDLPSELKPGTPEAAECGEELYSYDKEHFPKDLPEDLIRELMNSVDVKSSNS